MSRSLTLSAWLALRRGTGEGGTAPPVRPDLRPGEALVWIHCPDTAHLAELPSVSDALRAEGLAVRLLVTTPLADDQLSSGQLATALRGVTLMQPPPEWRGPVRDFLGRIRPDLLIWAEGHLRPVLLSEAIQEGFGRILVDVNDEGLVLEGGQWIPGAVAALVQGFDHALATDHVAAQRLMRLGLPDDRVEVTGALQPLPRPPDCNERERQDLAATIGPRPIWLAADLPLPELADVIAAQRQAARTAHRLLLIVAPARAEDHAAMLAELRDAGLNTASRWDGAEPEAATEVYLADGPTEMGLWFRLAQITYLGGTLGAGAPRHPFEVAALGTAILHGMHTSPHGESFARLTRAGAARAVRSGQNLGHAVEALLAPDRCATMVEAAWEVSTAGAVVANRLAELIRQHLAGRVI